MIFTEKEDQIKYDNKIYTVDHHHGLASQNEDQERVYTRRLQARL